jgi:hypothetical protein
MGDKVTVTGERWVEVPCDLAMRKPAGRVGSRGGAEREPGDAFPRG